MKIKVINYKEVQSTMDIALNHMDDNIVLITAEKQNKGRGRGSNEWFSPEGGFYGTYIIPLSQDLDFKTIVFFHYFASLIVSKSLTEICNIPFQIKWPNDIVFNNKKIAGILIEYITKTNQLNHILIGLGINNVSPSKNFPKELSNNSVSLSEIKNENISNQQLIEEINKHLLSDLNKVLDRQNLQLVEEYNKNSLFYNKKLKVNEEIYFCEGINEKGQLVLKSKKRILLLPIGDWSTLEQVE